MAWGPAAFWAAVLFLLSEIRGVPVLPSLMANDKLVHAALYAVMGVLLGWGRWFSGLKRVWPPLLAGYAYGAIDEWHQMFVPRRVPSFTDYVADVIGVTLGFITILLVLGAKARERSTAGEGTR